MAGEERLLVKVAVEGFKEFDAAMKGFDEGLEGAAEAAEDSAAGTEKFGKAASSLVYGLKAAITTLGALKIAKEAIAWARHGAAIEATEKHFKALAGGGAEAEEILRAIRIESNYTIDSMTGMQNAAMLMRLGLASSGEEAARMIVMAQRLGQEHLTANERVSQFALMLANRNTRMLDNYGLSIGVVTTRTEELMRTQEGMTRDTAFQIAVMEEAERGLKRLGDSVENQTSSWDRLGAATKNIRGELEKLASDALTPAAEGLALLLTFDRRLRDMYDEQTVAIDSTTSSYEEYITETINAQVVTRQLASTQADAVLEGLRNAETNEEVARNLDIMSEATYRAAQAAKNASADFNDMGIGAARASEGVVEFTADVIATKEEVDALSVAFQGRLGKAFDDFQVKTEGLRDKGEELRSKIAELEGRSWLTDAQRQQLEETRSRLSENDAAIAANAAAHEQAVGRIIFSMAQQVAAADGFTQQELEYLAALGQEYGVLDETSAAALANIKTNMDSVTSGTRTAEDAARDLRNSILLLESRRISIGVDFNVAPIQMPGAPPGSPMAYASGGTTSGRGSMLVGERGPELLTGVPGGARVLSSPTTARMGSGGNSVTNNYNLTTNSMTRPGGLQLEFSAMEMGSR